MILNREPSDDEKTIMLRNAGWKREQRFGMTIWHAPHCLSGMNLLEAWQQFKLGKRCEQPLVKGHDQ